MNTNRLFGCVLAILLLAGCEHDGIPAPVVMTDMGGLCGPAPMVKLESNFLAKNVLGSQNQITMEFSIEAQIAMKIDLANLTGKLSGLHNLEGAAWQIREGNIPTATGTIESNTLVVAKPTGMYLQPRAPHHFTLSIDTTSTSNGQTLWVQLGGPLMYSCDMNEDRWQRADFGLTGPTFHFVSNVCAGSPLYVPLQCPTIQEAVNVAVNPNTETTVLVEPGVYNENIVAVKQTNIHIRRDGEGEVVIDGGSKPALLAGMNTDGPMSIALTDITLRSKQMGMYAATDRVEFGGTLRFERVRFETTSVGLMVNFMADVQVVGSTFIGNGAPGTIGIIWAHANAGGKLLESTFKNLEIGVLQCSGNMPLMSETPGKDSNAYQSVETPFSYVVSC